MPRYNLRTLLILLAVPPPVLAVCWRYQGWKAEQWRMRLLHEVFGEEIPFSRK